MPGIFGVVDPVEGRSVHGQRELSDIVHLMSAAMQYETFYEIDILSSPEVGLCAGRVGFSDGNKRTAVSSLTPRVSVFTAGEPQASLLRVSPADDGMEAVGQGAVEVGQAYRQSGESALRLLDGSFAGLIVDRHEKKSLLFNDRYGMERIFIHRHGTRTFFSSEAKAILAVAPRTRDFDPKGLAEFLACGCTLQSQSLFREIDVLTGGTVITFRAGEGVSQRAYFDRTTWESAESVTHSQFVEGLSERLRSAVERAAAGPPSVGISLTAGLDSRMIMACLDAPPGTVPCYTFGSMYRDTYDVSVGREVARLCGQPHQVLPLDRRFLAAARTTVEQSVYISDGYIGFSGAAELYVNRLARLIAPVRMTGNWGGELLRGVRAFKYHVPKGGFLRPVLMQELEKSAELFADATTGNPLSYTLFHHLPALGYGRYAVERSQVSMRAPFLAKALVEWLYQAPPSARCSSDDVSAAVIRRRSQLLSIPTDFGLLGTDSAAAKSLRRWYRKGLSKAEYLASHGAPDWFAAFSASVTGGLIERPFLGIHKFQHFRRWFRGELAGVVREILLDTERSRLEAWFDVSRVRRMAEDHLRGRANYTDEIDKVATIALASRSLLEPSHTRPAIRVGA